MKPLLKACLLTVVLSIISVNVHAQFAPGIKAYTRFTDDRAGQLFGFGLATNYYWFDQTEGDFFLCSGFDMTLTKRFNGTATFEAYDSTTTPFTVTVPIRENVSDYMLQLGGGFFINPKHKTNALTVSFGLRALYRRNKFDYLQSYDKSVYDRHTIHYSPRIPSAINLGLNIGFGYCLKLNKIVIHPQMNFGFGSADRRNKHPWNKYPNYVEMSVTLMYLTRY